MSDLKYVNKVSDFLPSHYIIVILKLQRFRVLTLISGIMISYYSILVKH